MMAGSPRSTIVDGNDERAECIGSADRKSNEQIGPDMCLTHCLIRSVLPSHATTMCALARSSPT
jgi:hypothetical protein